jgi:outer membrane murein-binding lipoprotein Lpp
MFGSSASKIEKMERQIKELNALKADYRKEIDFAATEVKAKRMDQAKFEKVKARHEAEIKKTDAKIHTIWEKLEEEKKRKD